MDRRAKGLGAGTRFKDEVNAAVAKLNNATPEHAHEQIVIIKGVLEKVYLLSVLWETKGLKVAQAKTDDTPAVKRMEGLLYMKVFSPSIKDTVLRNSLLAEFQKPAKEINVDYVKTTLAKAVPKLWESLPDTVKNF
jgi:hypothetical protein